MSKLKLMISLFMLSLMFVSTSIAESVLLERTLKLDFRPEQANFLLLKADLVEQVPAVVRAVTVEKQNATNPNLWQFATLIKKSGIDESTKFTLLVHGPNGLLKLHAVESLSEGLDGEVATSPAALRELVIKSRKNYSDLERQYKVQKGQLERLESDAEIIGKLGRMIEVKEETSQVQERVTELDASIEAMRLQLASLGGEDPPRNFELRRRELTEQLKDLASKAMGIEANERSRKARTEVELQEMLMLVEETKYANLEDLQFELDRVRERRQRLEKDLGFEEGEFDDYLNW